MGVIYMKILNFGSLNIDYVYSVDHFVQKGETISSSQMNIFSGGKGLNQSTALGRAGAGFPCRKDRKRGRISCRAVKRSWCEHRSGSFR